MLLIDHSAKPNAAAKEPQAAMPLRHLHTQGRYEKYGCVISILRAAIGRNEKAWIQVEFISLSGCWRPVGYGQIRNTDPEHAPDIQAVIIHQKNP